MYLLQTFALFCRSAIIITKGEMEHLIDITDNGLKIQLFQYEIAILYVIIFEQVIQDYMETTTPKRIYQTKTEINGDDV